MIDWQAFDWQSFSTLTTGALAVAGATLVGWRQANISHRQAEIAERQTAILDRQTELEELKLRADLFERRFDVYSQTEAFIGSILAEEVSQSQGDFAAWAGRALFLFDEEVHERLEEIYETGMSVLNYRKTIAAIPTSKTPERDADIEDKINALWHLAMNLPPVFGDAMMLSKDRRN